MNGDGRDDLLIGDSGFTKLSGEAVGRIYLVAGRSLSSGELPLDAAGKNNEKTSQIVVWEGFSFGGSVFRLGDINGDGLADFGFSRSREDCLTEENVRTGSLFVLRGDVLMFSGPDGGEYRYYAWNADAEGAAGELWPRFRRDDGTENEDSFVVARLRWTTDDSTREGDDLTARTGDFDGDGRPELVVLTNQVVVSKNDEQNEDAYSWKALTFQDYFGDQGTVRDLFRTSVDTVTTPEEDVNGRQATWDFASDTPLDLDDNGIPDVAFGVPSWPGMLARAGTPVDSTGRIYLALGEPSLATLSRKKPNWLTNRDVPGLGLFVVHPPTNRPFAHQEEMRFIAPKTEQHLILDRSDGWKLDNLDEDELSVQSMDMDHRTALLSDTVPGRAELSPFYEIGATVRTNESWGNAYITFDYARQDETINPGNDRHFRIGYSKRSQRFELWQQDRLVCPAVDITSSHSGFARSHHRITSLQTRSCLSFRTCSTTTSATRWIQRL